MVINVVLVSLHLLGVGLVIGSVAFSLILTYQQLTSENVPLFLRLRNMGSIGAGFAIISGIIMAFRYGIPLKGNFWFDAKLVLIVLDGLIAQLIIKKALSQATDDLQMTNGRLRKWAWLSVLIVIAIVAISVFRAKTHV